MPNFEVIKKRIKSVETTAKITFAMKMVATSKLQKFKKVYAIYQDYLHGFYSIFVNIFSDKNHNIDLTNRLLFQDYVDGIASKPKTLWIVIGSDIGMCGAFNSAIVKKIVSEWNTHDAFFFFGNKIQNLVQSQRPQIQIIKTFDHIEKDLEPEYYSLIAKQIYQTFFKMKFTHLKIVRTKFVNSLVSYPLVFEVLPLNKDNYMNKEKVFPEVNVNEHELPGQPTELISKILPHFLSALLYGALIESKVAESSSRYNAMLTATDNANALIDMYKLEYNRKRQASITQEIIEIISGAVVKN